ncbi:apolipoprotein N-acyltransferase [Haematospirillum jordaniae]|nr:apolipoprotein N-acyltransferase [Haematospirillum jordaniae]NKD44934.1 apolipoprotein N-acyltransferase [Haematospirillum jordaniae]NKD57869.1 apolipoprotein N-acyltransferase [Haematospirillum jordaniae]NKD59830.1 apolipoprotein N-acyltransferase [Haematospirillum jordaniae]NKD67697.1 apolipoprotein N-acyltransferase [Haematospirillum jordaniae]NKD79861.1 apolipoprotein N-acyltransferase [Haematospirillum jordaniae]
MAPESFREHLARIALYPARLSVMRQLVLVFAAGLASALALPPVFFLPVLFVSFPVLIQVLEHAHSRRHAFLMGWSFGFGHFCAGLYWISHALLLDPVRFGWMVPLAVGGLSALMATYIGAATALVHALRLKGLSCILGLASLWTVMELLRGWLLTGFPWNPLGSVWTDTLPVLQTAAWIGITGLSLVTVVMASLPVMLLYPGGRYAMSIVGILFAVMVGAGTARIPEEPGPSVSGVRLRLVQPAIPQTLKWQEETRMANLGQYMTLSMAPPAPDDPAPTHVIWGETALPWAIDGVTDAELRSALSAVPKQAAHHGAHAPLLVTGAIRRTPPGQKPARIWNSMIAVDASGSLQEHFDKAHLVPFGEYVPLRSILPIDKVTPGHMDYSAGAGPRTLSLPGLPPVSPLICYEIIFPGAVTEQDKRPEWILNLTNDGWYGVSTGPYQHLATAIGRAVEEGLPVIRAANTGISAVIDPWGRIVKSLGLETAGFVDSNLPHALPETVYGRWHHRIPLWIATLLLFAALALRTRFSDQHISP